MRQRWKESALLSGILVLSAGLVYGGLSHWKRTPHLYEYDRNQINEQEKNPELVQQGDPQEENRRERQKPKNKRNQQNPDTDRQEMDDKRDNEQDTSNSDNKRADSDGDDAMNGDGGPGDSNVPDMNLPSGNPAGTPVPVDDAEPTASPVPTNKAEPTHTPEPEQDKVVKLTCTWPDRKSLLYGKEIPKDTIQVTAECSSGEKKKLSSGEYTIRQLKNDSVGEHTMTVSYNKDESINCKVDYVVNNFTKSLTYSWPTKDQCYKGEEFPSSAITVKTKMADGTTKTTTKYEITGYNNVLLNVEQKFTITYKDTTINKTFTAEGTCRFLNRQITLHCYYYSDAEMKNLVASRTYNGDYDYYVDETISLSAYKGNGSLSDDPDAYYKKKQYTIKEISLAEVDSAGNSKNKSLPYRVKERFFDPISLTKKYVLAE